MKLKRCNAGSAHSITAATFQYGVSKTSWGRRMRGSRGRKGRVRWRRVWYVEGEGGIYGEKSIYGEGR